MRLASMILRDYALVKDSGIDEIHITFTERVQIIIGSNGSGKTSVLRQLSPMPATRSRFGKEGFKSQSFEKDGTWYRLESEYEKPSSPHLFYEGDSDENLNVGRTTDTQQELIAHHLGVTQEIDDLIMNRHTFPEWGSAKRREFLMAVNPGKIGFILPLIKKNASNIKACKARIQGFQTRKITLEQEFLDPSVMEMLLQEKQTIEQELGDLQQNIMDIEVGLRTLTFTGPMPSVSHLPSVRKTVTRYRVQLKRLSHVNRDDRYRQNDRETMLTKIGVCDQRVFEIDEEIVKQAEHLSECETRYNELTIGGDLQGIDNTIARLEGERDKLHIERPPFELTSQELQLRYQELEVIKDHLQIFENRDVPLLPRKKHKHREQILESARYKQSSYNHSLSDLERKYEELSRKHTISPRDIPESPCAKERCPLYTHFMGEYESAEHRRTRLAATIARGKRKIGRLNLFVAGLVTFFENSKPFTDQINWLVAQAQSNPILHTTLRQIDILQTLSTNPNLIPRKLAESYDHIAQWIKLKSIQSDLETSYALKSRQISSESHDTIKLVSTIEGLKKSLYGLRKDIKRIAIEKASHETALRDITTFSAIKTTLLELQQSHRVHTESLLQGHEKDQLQYLRRGIETLRGNHFIRLSEIEKTLRSQASLKDRYEEEVIGQMGQIEKEMADLQQIEKALIAIARENQVDFINTLFKQANLLIESIWTVPFRIEPISIEDNLTYEFQVSGDNQTLREMSQCSAGQLEILSLTINLALRIILGYNNIPLCLDEPGSTFDESHKQNFIYLLKRLLDDNIVSQLFMVSHNAIIHEAFSASETLVIREDNILLPSIFNEHVTMR